VQKFIVKYGLAAHLAVLAVAPLFLYSVVPPATGAVALLWLSLVVAAWVLLEPSLRSGELLRDARRRVAKNLLIDPLTWMLLALVVAAGICAANAGVSLSYNAETASWCISEASSAVMPGSVEGCGFFPFSALTATAVLVLGVRHSLGRAARTGFMMGSSALAGIVAVVDLILMYLGYLDIDEVIRADEFGYSFVGLSYGVYFLLGTVALIGALENEWHSTIPLFFFCIGGTAVGLFCFSPVYMILAFALAEIVLLAYSVVFVRLTFQPTGQLKVLAGVMMFLVLAGLLVAALFPEDGLVARLEAISSLTCLPEGYREVRAALSRIAFKSWLRHLWLGTGLGSFSIDFRFAATADDWALLPRGATAMPNGWWMLLCERGVLGFVLLVMPFGYLVYSYVLRLVAFVRNLELPHPACFLAILLVPMAVAFTFYDCSALRVDFLSVFFPTLAVSALSFPIVRGGRVS